MKIGIISDTHGCLTTFNKVMDNYFYDADFIIHAGDVLYHGPRNNILPEYNPKGLAVRMNESTIPFVICSGNCDTEVDGMVLDIPIQSPYAFVMVDNIRIIVNHGHKLDDEEKVKIAKRFKADMLITGHTHIPVLNKIDKTIFLNPGSPAMSKRPDGIGTAARIIGKTVEVFDVDSGNVLMSETLF